MARSPLTIGGRRLVTADTHSGYDGAVGSVRGGRGFRDIIQKLTALWHMALCNGENKHSIMFSPPGRIRVNAQQNLQRVREVWSTTLPYNQFSLQKSLKCS